MVQIGERLINEPVYFEVRAEDQPSLVVDGRIMAVVGVDVVLGANYRILDKVAALGRALEGRAGAAGEGSVGTAVVDEKDRKLVCPLRIAKYLYWLLEDDGGPRIHFKLKKWFLCRLYEKYFENQKHFQSDFFHFNLKISKKKRGGERDKLISLVICKTVLQEDAVKSRTKRIEEMIIRACPAVVSISVCMLHIAISNWMLKTPVNLSIS